MRKINITITLSNEDLAAMAEVVLTIQPKDRALTDSEITGFLMQWITQGLDKRYAQSGAIRDQILTEWKKNEIKP